MGLLGPFRNAAGAKDRVEEPKVDKIEPHVSPFVKAEVTDRIYRIVLAGVVLQDDGMTLSVSLIAAGLLAGSMNALAGGGSFVTLPVLIAAGLPSVVANASSTVALYPAGIASAWVYRRGLGEVCGVPLRPTLAATLAGGLLGSLLLLRTPEGAFDKVLPWLLLVASVTLIVGPRLGVLVRAHVRAGLPTVIAIQVGLGLYGGYFGGAVGLMMIAAWSLLDAADLKALNPARTLLVSAANTVAVLCFALAGAVHWADAGLVGAGAVCGSYAGAHLGRRLPASLVRSATIVLAVGMTALFFLRAYA